MVRDVLFHVILRSVVLSAGRALNRPSNRYAPSTLIVPIVCIELSVCCGEHPARDIIRALTFGGAAYLSLGLRHRSAKLGLRRYAGGRDVDLALRLNVLAVFAVFAFVGAILLGAF